MSPAGVKTLRTVVQGVLGLAASAPLLVAASGLTDKSWGVGVFLAVTAAVTRLSHVPAVVRLTPSWLRVPE